MTPAEAIAQQIRFGAKDRHTFNYDGRTFVVHGGVFSPREFRSTEIFTRNMPFASGRSFLEIGGGAGVTAVMAALSGCRPVVVTDISAAAVENMRENVRLHGVDDLVSVRHGDLFDVIDDNETFDTIYWNSPFVRVPADYEFDSELQRAFFDAEYKCHEQFLRLASHYQAPSGSLILGFGSIGDVQELQSLCQKFGYRTSTLASETTLVGENTRVYSLLELVKEPGERKTPD